MHEAAFSAGRRNALVVATSTYTDPAMRPLRSPGSDARAFAAALRDPSIGGFAVTTVLDARQYDMKLAIDRFLAAQEFTDLLVVYISGHGFRDLRGRLYFAATDTRMDALTATGVESSWLLSCMEDCLAERQVVILDCCFSGAFMEGHKAAGDDNLDLTQLTGELDEREPSGRGRIVLTASRATESSFEGHTVTGRTIKESVFTAGLLDGLCSGEADLDGDGLMSVDDVFRHAQRFVRRHGTPQSPQKSAFATEGTIWLARNPHPVAVEPPVSVSVRQLMPEPVAVPAIAIPAAMPNGARPSTPAALGETGPPVPGQVIGWGGQNDSIAQALASGVEFGSFVVPPGLADIVVLSAGSRHMLALRSDGEVVAWGESSFGCARVPRRKLRYVVAVGVAAGGSHSLALSRDGTVVGWGNNSSGQAGAPRRNSEVRAISAGGWHSLALHEDGQVSAWGDNSSGQIAVPPGLRDVVAVAAGRKHSLALCANGRVATWGAAGSGTVPSGDLDAQAIAAGDGHSIVLTADGDAMVWGQMGSGSARARDVRAIAAGDSHGLALHHDGRVTAWGDNAYRQCAVPALPGRAIAVAAGGIVSLAIVDRSRR